MRVDRPVLARWGLRLAGLCVLATFSCPEPLDERQEGQEVIYEFLVDGDLESADLLLDDCWPVERFEPVCLDGLPSWDEDPYDERYWRMIFYSLRPLRHLVWAYEETGDPAYADKLVAILRSHLDTYPAYSPEWDPHTTAFRTMVLVDAYWKLERWGYLDDELADDLETRVRGHARYLYEPVNYESSFNHGFSEAAALLLVAENFPERDSGGSGCAPSWAARARTRLDNLMVDAVDEDGVEVEQSPYYHFYVLNFVWQIDNWARRYGVPLSDTFHDKFEAMVRYATLIPTPDGYVPLIGSGLTKNVRSDSLGLLPQMGAVYPELQYVLTAGEEGEEPAETVVLFPSSGQFIARSGFGPPEEFEQQTHLVFDVGPYRTDHSHLDALALHLYAAGRTLLPDSGLYSYEPGTFNEYFPSTRAHNTVVVDGGDQRKRSAEARTTARGDGWAYQSGANTTYAGVEHDRGVLLLQRDLVLVIDELDGGRDHEFAQTWHLFVGAEVVGDEHTLLALDETGQPALAIHQADADALELACCCGEEDPVVQGWCAETYEEAMANQALEYRVEADHALFVTLLAAGEYAAEDAVLTRSLDDGDLTVDVALETAAVRVEITDLFAEGEAVAVHPLD